MDHLESTNLFRPISLCSTIYKIISKLLTDRLKLVLNKLSHPSQGAFTPHRFIQDNILMSHEIFNAFKRKQGKVGCLAINLDMEKAYDMSRLEFYQRVFDSLWIRSEMD